MKLCLIILSVPWYMFNGLEHTAILSHFLTFITGNCVRVGRVRVDMESVNRSRLLRIPFSADLTLYWFPVCCFLCVVSCVLFPVCCFRCVVSCGVFPVCCFRCVVSGARNLIH
jgi:hypothetical protein